MRSGAIRRCANGACRAIRAPGRPDGPRGYRAALEAPFLAYAELHGKPRWADKTPYYVGEIDQVKRVFPEARIVNLVRDGRDVALSLLGVPFGPGNVWAAARQWRAAVDAGDTADARYDGDVLTIRYEHLVAEPDAAARQVCAFCEIAYRPEMLAIEDSAAGKLASGQEGWFTELFAGIGTRSVGKWRTGMTGAQQALFAAGASEALRRHGYEVPDAGEPPPVRRRRTPRTTGPSRSGTSPACTSGRSADARCRT